MSDEQRKTVIEQAEERSSLAVTAVVLLWEAFKAIVSALAGWFVGEPQVPAAPAVPGGEPKGRETTERAADRNLHPERDTESHYRRGAILVTCSYIASLAAAAGFLFIYWSNGNNLLLGCTLALCLGAMGSALVLYAHWLIPEKQAIEPREPLASSIPEREDFAENFDIALHDLHRRNLLKWIGIATAGMVVSIVISLLRSLGRPPGPSLFDTVWKRGQRLMKSDGTPVSVDALQSEKNFLIVFPEDSIGDEKAQTVLLRVKERNLQLPSDRSTWAPMGYIAYSRVCTHAGCVVGLYETTTHLLMCPCHQSTFDVLKAAQPTSGPAARALPQLPLYVDGDGFLRAGGGFSQPPGPGFWWLPKND
jgi:ubiquinol-cytochrome c reductase iron-sulfur subunit